MQTNLHRIGRSNLILREKKSGEAWVFHRKMRNTVWLWVWVVTIMVVETRWCCLGCWEQERVALLQLKAAINHPHGTSLPSWETSYDCCQWNEIECDNTTRRVIQLSLGAMRDKNLGGWYFNASLFLPFQQLRSLYFCCNSLVGWVENQGFERLSKLTDLEVLDLTDNHFNNSILSSLGGLSSLKSLFLSQNDFKGSIHFNNSDFINLKELDLSYNKIEKFERIPGLGEASILRNLELLQLSGNLFTNSILASLSGLPPLKFLGLAKNLFKGSIHMGALSNVEELDMSENIIDHFENSKGKKSLSQLKVLHLNRINSESSNLLQSLGAFSTLKIVYFQDNNVQGTITSQGLRNLSNLEELIMDDSFLNKNFLQSIGVLTSLKALSLIGCGLNGTLPTRSLCEVKRLQVLYLTGNQLKGILPHCLGNLTSLRVIDLSDNQLTGNIASSPLSTLTSLEYLSFSNNQFQFPISFKSFSNHSNLEVILCNNNKLIVEPMINSWAPKFQLKVLELSSCTSNEPNVAFPNFLYYQSDLRIVDLSHNNLTRSFPSWLLENNTRLERLYLRDNSLVGHLSLPSFPSPNILVIDISNNNLHGQIPENISSTFPNLGALNMSINFFEGNLISRFNHMNSLWFLDLSNNSLSGLIPETFAMGCLSLLSLKLSNNNFYGQISPRALNLSQLQFLYLDGNKFAGKILDNFSPMPLQVLDVSNNKFTGKLPRWIGNMTAIGGIVMSRNKFQGPIPEEFCKLRVLGFLDLSENILSGSLPSCFNISNIRHVHLYKNRLEGSISHIFRNSSFLVALDLGENYFSGKIPSWIGSLSTLSILLLKANHFEGEIPVQACHLSNLRIMDLSQNYLFGSIPPCLSNITSRATNEITPGAYLWTGFIEDFLLGYDMMIRIVDKVSTLPGIPNYPSMDVEEEVGFTTKSIYYSYKGKILNMMSGIDLSCNELSGEIPTEIGNLSNIRALNFSHNKLVGSIPTTFSNLRQVESVDLSYNNLNGRIPSQLIELNSLAVFSVAYNNLSGTTPDRKAQFATFEESSYEGNPLLCGPPLHNNCSKAKLPLTIPSPSNGKEEDSGYVDMGIFYVSFTVTYITILLGIAIILYINPYWRQTWFYLIEVCITKAFYVVVDNFPKLPNFRNT